MHQVRVAKAQHLLAHLLGAGVGGEDQHHVPEIRLPAVVVGQRRVVHHLKEDVEQVRVRLFDLVEHHHGVRILAHRIGQKTALLESDVPRRRADQPRDGVLLRVLAHVEAQKLHPEHPRQLLGQLGLAHPGRAGEEE